MVKIVKKAPSNLDLHPLILSRWSPRAFDIEVSISDQDLHAILEAARLAPSAYNEQPWRFIIGKRNDEVFNQILDCLIEFNQQWAKNASALMVVAGRLFRENGKLIKNFQYDLGLAVSQATFEAHHRGFFTHQMSGFKKEEIIEIFTLVDLEPVVVVAIGKQADSDILPPDMAVKEVLQTNRKELKEIVIKGLDLRSN